MSPQEQLDALLRGIQRGAPASAEREDALMEIITSLWEWVPAADEGYALRSLGTLIETVNDWNT